MDQNQIREFVNKYDPSITRYEAYYYGYPEIADELCRLVMEGEKRATTGLLKLYELENEPLPREGDYSVIDVYKRQQQSGQGRERAADDSG